MICSGVRQGRSVVNGEGIEPQSGTGDDGIRTIFVVVLTRKDRWILLNGMVFLIKTVLDIRRAMYSVSGWP